MTENTAPPGAGPTGSTGPGATSCSDFLYAVANLCLPVSDDGVVYSQRMVALLIDGLRYGADPSQSRS